MTSFGVYGSEWKRGMSLLELYSVAETGELHARAEDSGSEGVYVEVARWCHKRSDWFRFAFAKYLGGEDGHESDPWQLAEWTAAKINAASKNRHVAWVHSLDNYGDGKTTRAELLSVLREQTRLIEQFLTGELVAFPSAIRGQAKEAIAKAGGPR